METSPYELLVMGRYSEASEIIELMGRERSSEYRCLKALLLALQGEMEKCRTLLSWGHPDEDDPRVLSYCLEAELFSSGGENVARIKSLAERAIQANAEAIFARRVMAHIREAEADFSGALSHYQFILERFPGDEKTLLDVARLQILMGREAEGRASLRRAPPSVQKYLYAFSLLLRSRRGFLVLGAIAFLMLSNLSGRAASVVLIPLGLMAMAYALWKRDGLILSMSIRVFLTIIVFAVIRFVLLRLVEV